MSLLLALLGGGGSIPGNAPGAALVVTLSLAAGAADGVRNADAPGMAGTVFFSMVGGAASNDVASGGNFIVYPAWRRTGRRGR